MMRILLMQLQIMRLSNTKIQELTKNYSGHKYYAAKGLVLMAKNFYELEDSYQATYILEKVIENFSVYEDVVTEAQQNYNALKKKKQNEIHQSISLQLKMMFKKKETNMKMNKISPKMIKYTTYILVVLFSMQICFAQEEDDNIGTEVINVVKPYTPTISDAFKIKEKPEINDTEELEKKQVDYSIFSVPVASTFTPSKGKAAAVEKQAPKKLYNNYASLAVGNYLNVLAEFYATIPMGRSENFTVGLNHHSTQGEIKEVQLDDKFYDTDLNLIYSKREHELAYQIEGLFKHQQYNWYGTSYDLTDLQRTILMRHIPILQVV